MPVLGPTGIAMLQNCQAAADYLNDWERGFIESISLKSGVFAEVAFSEKQISALIRIWKKLPASLQNLAWKPDDADDAENRKAILQTILDKGIPF